MTIWDGVEERFRKKLALWKRQYIWKGGRITLIKSTLSSLPLYLMSNLPLPRLVEARSDPKEFSVGWRSFSSETPLSQVGHYLFGEEEWGSWSEKLVYHEQSSSL